MQKPGSLWVLIAMLPSGLSIKELGSCDQSPENASEEGTLDKEPKKFTMC